MILDLSLYTKNGFSYCMLKNLYKCTINLIDEYEDHSKQQVLESPVHVVMSLIISLLNMSGTHLILCVFNEASHLTYPFTKQSQVESILIV